MELPLWAESIWRTVDGVEKDQEADFLGHCGAMKRRRIRRGEEKVVEKKHH